MATDEQIALVLIEGAIIALPLWLVVVQHLSEVVDPDKNPSGTIGTIGGLFIGGLLAYFSGLALLGALTIAALVVLGTVDSIDRAIWLVLAFAFATVVIGMLRFASLMTNRGENFRRFLIVLVSMLAGGLLVRLI